jgi:ABC-type phosphate transport system permease subunit
MLKYVSNDWSASTGLPVWRHWGGGVIMKIICTLGLFITCLLIAFLLGLAAGIGIVARGPVQPTSVAALAVDVYGTAQM